MYDILCYLCIGSSLATPLSSEKTSSSHLSRISFDYDRLTSSSLEVWIDKLDHQLPPLTTFILPGGAGSPLSSHLHLCRSVCRRLERGMSTLVNFDKQTIDTSTIKFINRLSDYLFVAARYAAHKYGNGDTKWEKISFEEEEEKKWKKIQFC